MNRLFNLDNKFFTGVNKVVDVAWLGILAFLMSIPIFTFGAVCSALYYTTNKQIYHNRGYVTSKFFQAFKANFKNATITWLIELGLSLVFIADIYILYNAVVPTSKLRLLIFLFVLLLGVVWNWGTFAFCYHARFDQDPKLVRKNAMIISMAHPLTGVFNIVMLLVAAFAVYVFPPVILVVGGIYYATIHSLMERVFHKYMSPEDIAKEEEEYRMDF